MPSRGHLTVFVFVMMLAAIPARLNAYIWHLSGCKGKSELQMQQKIEQENNPVSKAKCQIQLARLRLHEGILAYGQNHFSKGSKLLGGYLHAARDAWSTLKVSGRDAVKSPDGFKDLDISLRESGRLLKDLARSVPYPQSESVEDVLKQSTTIHDEVLDALFPGLRLHRPPGGHAPTRGAKKSMRAGGPG